MTTTEKIKEKLLSFKQVAIITNADIGGECSFIADPFIVFDYEAGKWVLFAEIAAPARRQNIGILTSSDLKTWEFYGDAVKGSRESFPYIFKNKASYLMSPCVEATSAPGLVPIYKSASLLGPWTLANQLELKKLVNDRVFMPTPQEDLFYLIYGTRTIAGPTLEYVEVTFDESIGELSFGKSKALLHTSPINYLKCRLFGYPRLTMRPGGSLIPVDDGYVLPIQGTRTGKYGECFGLIYISQVDQGIKVIDSSFIKPADFNTKWMASHHLSYYKQNDVEVIAVDGHFGSAMWEVRIFTNGKIHS